MYRITAVLLTFCCLYHTSADIVLNTNNHSENFDSLGSTTITGVFSASAGVQANVPGSTGFVGTKLGGTGGAATALTADSGTLNSGGIYSYGAASASDRALGALASGTNFMGFGVKVVNNTGTTLESLTFSFTQENWRSSTVTQNVLTAGYLVDQTGSVATSTFLTASGFTSVSALDMVGPTPVASNGALDGNLAANQVFRTVTLSGLNLVNSGVIFFRWQDVNDTGNDAGLAMDNLVIQSVSAVPEPGTLILAGIASLGLVGWRRRNKLMA